MSNKIKVDLEPSIYSVIQDVNEYTYFISKLNLCGEFKWHISSGTSREPNLPGLNKGFDTVFEAREALIKYLETR